MLLLTTLLSALLVTLAPSSANAHTPAIAPTCTALTVDLTSYNGNADNRVTVVVDGTAVVDNQRFRASYSYSHEWSPTQDHTWEVRVTAGDDPQWNVPGPRYTQPNSGTQSACEQPPTQPSYTVVIWKMPGNPTSPTVTWPQSYVERFDQTNTDISPAVERARELADDTCDAYQVDVYNASSRTEALIAGGVLNGPGDPDEDFATNAEPRYATVYGDGTCDTPATEVDVPAQPTVSDVCGPDYTVPTLDDTESYAYTVDRSGVTDGAGTVVITATLKPGNVWQGLEGDAATAPQTWTYDVTNEPCDAAVEVPAQPTLQDVCGPDYGTPALPADGAYEWSVDDSALVDGAGVVTITATLNDGYVWTGGSTDPQTWSYDVTNEPCDVPVTGVARADVVVTGATCWAPGTATAGDTERASWTVSDVPAAGGTATFVAVADQGAAFEAGLPGVSDDLATRTFTLDVPAAGGALCTNAPPPVQPPTQVTPPAAQATPPTLPRTGFDISSILAMGALLALAGATLVVRRVRAEG